MKMAKASEADLDMAMELSSALDDLTRHWRPTGPEKAQNSDDSEDFDIDDREQCQRVLNYLLDVAGRASISRVVFGLKVLLDPRNKCVDPDADTIEHHPDVLEAWESKTAKPAAEWDDSKGNVLWWSFPVNESPWYGKPTDSGWSAKYTHWTSLITPNTPA